MGELVIKRALEVASKVLQEEKRSNGTPFIDHAIAVAGIVSDEIGLMHDSVAAVYLHEASRMNPSVLDDCRKEFAPEIIIMAQSLNKISEIKPKDTGLQADNYRKLIVSYSVDPRVTLIKLADRLEIMRSLDMFTKSKQIKKATETLLLYAPLAHQLGLYNIKSELEDLSFKYTDPEQYRAITNKLKATERERENLTVSFIKPLEKRLKEAGVCYELKSRTKTAYSIWKKMQAQQIAFEGVADVFAIRFIIDCAPEEEKSMCWKVYSFVTEEYEPDTKRLRDWITVPKPNGYESLHTTVSNREGAVIEVQIRTRRMDDIAENGHASHWSYKGVKSEQGLSSWLQGVKRMLESPEKLGGGHVESISLDEIFVFTPDGDLRRLPAGSTVLDFAFDIHSNLGIKCSGAKINGKPASIRENLKTGDVVEVMSTKNQKPSMDWLNFVITSKAKAKIKQKIKEEEGKMSQMGRELLERRMNNWKLELNDDVLHLLSKHFKYKLIGDFFAALAKEEVDISNVKSFLLSKDRVLGSEGDRDVPAIAVTESKQASGADYLIIDERLNNVGYKLAKCCNPIHGDDVFGFVSVKEGIKIHRISCPNAARLIDNYPYRIQKVRWRESVSGNHFQTTLRVISYEEGAVGRQIMDIVTKFAVSLRLFSMSESGDKYEAKVQLSVPNNQVLDKIIFNLRKIKGVKSVSRVSNG